MAQEIERKFLVVSDGWRPSASSEHYRQGYLAPGPPAAIRVRVAGRRAFLNIKEATTRISRSESEYEIPLEEADAILESLCVGHIIDKHRHMVEYAGCRWEIDVFEGANAGLTVAEIELDREDQPVVLPSWVGREVSGDIRYFNSYLALHPYEQWKGT